MNNFLPFKKLIYICTSKIANNSKNFIASDKWLENYLQLQTFLKANISFVILNHSLWIWNNFVFNSFLIIYILSTKPFEFLLFKVIS